MGSGLLPIVGGKGRDLVCLWKRIVFQKTHDRHISLFVGFRFTGCVYIKSGVVKPAYSVLCRDTLLGIGQNT